MIIINDIIKAVIDALCIISGCVLKRGNTNWFNVLYIKQNIIYTIRDVR